METWLGILLIAILVYVGVDYGRLLLKVRRMHQQGIYDEEDITKAKEYPWLERAHGKEALTRAKENPIIIHYAGKNPKIWKRKYSRISQYYWKYIEGSPFYNKEYYFPKLTNRLRSVFLWLLIKICPIRLLRKKLKQMRKSQLWT